MCSGTLCETKLQPFRISSPGTWQFLQLLAAVDRTLAAVKFLVCSDADHTMVCNSFSWSRACQAIVFHEVHNRLRLCTVHDAGNCFTSSLNPAWTVAKKFKWISLIRRPIIIGYWGLGNCQYTTSCDFINWHTEQTTLCSCIIRLLCIHYWN